MKFQFKYRTFSLEMGIIIIFSVLLLQIYSNFLQSYISQFLRSNLHETVNNQTQS